MARWRREPRWRARRLPRAWAAVLVLLAAGAAMLPSVALAANIVVTIDGVRSDKGMVLVALFNKPDGFPDGDYSIRHLKTKASRAPIMVRFDDLPPGRYAVGAYHDENNNGKLDTGFIGLPVEGYALSNGVRAILFRPRFGDASFPVDEATARVTLHIQY